MSWSGRPDRGVVSAMCDALAHRGPDASNVVDLGAIVLGHRRLSVIDISHTNDQPQFDASGDLCLVFNGEIYNFRELRTSCEALGSVFRTQGDTEVLLECYRHWGRACLEQLNGMFAFALWDGRSGQLLLARDRVGEKPLFYANIPGGFAFASEPRALRLHPGVSREVDFAGLRQFLTLNYVTGERSLTRGIRRLPPGHWMVVGAAGRSEQGTYWDLAASFRNKRVDLTFDDAASELRERIDDAVRMRLVSDVPLGAFLSGGIDSATVVASMTRASANVDTFTVGFGEPGFDEVDAARAVANHLGVRHHEARFSPDAAAWLEAMIVAADEPLADTSMMPTWFLARFARRHVTVALSGDGGDEAFAGYETYLANRAHRLTSRMPRLVTRAVRTIADRSLPVSFDKVPLDFKIRTFLQGADLSPSQAHFSWRRIFDEPAQRRLLRDECAAALDAEQDEAASRFEDLFRRVSDLDPLDQELYVDSNTWLPDDVLTKVDRATMAHSLESRAPFLDHRLLEFAASLPSRFKMQGITKKRVLRQSQVERLRASTLKQRKLGFNAPFSRWVAGPLLSIARDVLSDAALGAWFKRTEIDALIDDHLAKKRDNGYRLFGLVCFALWLRRL